MRSTGLKDNHLGREGFKKGFKKALGTACGGLH